MATALLIAIVAAGCGSGDSASPPSTTATSVSKADPGETSTSLAGAAGSEDQSADGCDIVSDEVVSKVLGVDVVRREGNAQEGGVSCIKGLERTGDPSGYYYVSVGVLANGGALFDQFTAMEGSQPVEGLGDKAVYVSSAGALYLLDGSDAIQIQVVKAGVPGSQDEAVTIARDVLDGRS